MILPDAGSCSWSVWCSIISGSPGFQTEVCPNPTCRCWRTESGRQSMCSTLPVQKIAAQACLTSNFVSVLSLLLANTLAFTCTPTSTFACPALTLIGGRPGICRISLAHFSHYGITHSACKCCSRIWRTGVAWTPDCLSTLRVSDFSHILFLNKIRQWESLSSSR